MFCPVCEISPRSKNRRGEFNKTCGKLKCSKNIYFGTDRYIELYDEGKIPLLFSKPSGPRKLFSEVERFLSGENEFNFTDSHYKVFLASAKVRNKFLSYEDIDKLELAKHFKPVKSFYVKECDLFKELRYCSGTKTLNADTKHKFEFGVWWIINGEFSYPLLKTGTGRLEFLKSIGAETCCRMCKRELSIVKWSFDKSLSYMNRTESLICKRCLDTSSKQRLSEYGVEFKLEAYKKQSKTIVSKIEEGTFVPCQRNFKNGGIYYNSVKYRSSWEVVYQILNDVKGINLEYETQRFEYFTDENKRRIYIADFYDRKRDLIIEVKPSCEIDEGNNLLKRLSVEKSGKNFRYVSEIDIKNLLKGLNKKELNLVKSFIRALQPEDARLIYNKFELLRD